MSLLIFAGLSYFFLFLILFAFPTKPRAQCAPARTALIVGTRGIGGCGVPPKLGLKKAVLGAVFCAALRMLDGVFPLVVY